MSDSPRDHRGATVRMPRILRRGAPSVNQGAIMTPGGRTSMRLPARLGPKPRILFVGINPSLTSARVGHHFAGPGNPFYRLLHAAGFVPDADDVRGRRAPAGVRSGSDEHRRARHARGLRAHAGRLRARAKAVGRADRRGAAGGGGVRGRHRVSTVLRTVGQLRAPAPSPSASATPRSSWCRIRAAGTRPIPASRTSSRGTAASSGGRRPREAAGPARRALARRGRGRRRLRR